jgi:urea transporter
MLQNNALTGLLFLVGIFYNSWILGLGAIIGAIISTNSASILKYSKEDIDNGLYGFNGALVGVAVLFFFEINIFSIILIIAGSFLSTVAMCEMKKRIPAYTAPFVISTWVVILIIKFFNLVPFISSASLQANSLNLFSTISTGVGQVMFQGSIITGLIFIIAILINSRTSAIYAVYGSLLGGLFALLLSLPLDMINVGLFGYNAVLCGIALGTKKWSGFVFATFAILLSVLINYWLGGWGIITLTAPFVIATWIILLIKNEVNKYYAKQKSMGK